MSRVFSVSASGYNASLRRPASARSLEDQTLGSTIFTATKKRYGAVRITHELRARGVRMSTKRTVRLMRQRGLRASQPRGRVRTTNAQHSEPIEPP